jgi:hypothetical protein
MSSRVLPLKKDFKESSLTKIKYSGMSKLNNEQQKRSVEILKLNIGASQTEFLNFLIPVIWAAIVVVFSASQNHKSVG